MQQIRLKDRLRKKPKPQKMSKLFFSLIVCFIFLECVHSERRDFFKSLKSENVFLDTFSLFNLKEFGISEHSKEINGKKYFQINSDKSAIILDGFFRKEKNAILFLPSGSDSEILFIDPSPVASAGLTEARIKTKTILYVIRGNEPQFDYDLKDTVRKVEIYVESQAVQPEVITFSITKDLDIASLERVNCKQDTLIMKFIPKQQVYFKTINTALCL